MTCTEQPYLQRASARGSMNRRNKRNPGSVSHIYLCENCGKYHLKYRLEPKKPVIPDEKIKALQDRFTASFKDAAPTIKRIIYNRYDDLGPVEDTFQEIALRVWKRFLTANLSRNLNLFNEPAWMVTVSKFDLKELCRRVPQSVQSIFCDQLPHVCETYDYYDYSYSVRPRINSLEPVIESLNDKQKEVVKLTLAGYDTRMISYQLDMRSGDVNLVLRNATTKLKNLMTAEKKSNTALTGSKNFFDLPVKKKQTIS